MFKNGAVKEVKRFLKLKIRKELSSNKIIGIEEISRYLNGELNIDQTIFIHKLIENKLLTIRAAENVVRILPPLNVKKTEIDQALKIINKVCIQLS